MFLGTVPLGESEKKKMLVHTEVSLEQSGADQVGDSNHLQNINYHFPIPIHPSNRPTPHPLIPIIPSSSQFICCSFLYTFRSSFSPLLGGINDVSSGDLAFVHQVVHLLEFTHANRFVWGLDESASEELDGLG